MSRRLYAVHRWIAALAGAQLLVWTVSGLVFSLVPEESVSGSPVAHAHESPIPDAPGALDPGEALRRAAVEGAKGASKIELRSSPAGLYYVVRGSSGPLRLDARTGALAPVTLAEAEETARRDQPGRPPVASSSLVERDARSEYRTKPLPAFRVELADGRGTVVYVDAKTGDVTARRGSVWRVYDALYLLHTMDYGARGSVNSPLLAAASLLGLVTVVSGLVVWGARILARRRAARRAAATAGGG